MSTISGDNIQTKEIITDLSNYFVNMRNNGSATINLNANKMYEKIVSIQTSSLGYISDAPKMLVIDDNITNCHNMFYNAGSSRLRFSISIGKNVTDMSQMFMQSSDYFLKHVYMQQNFLDGKKYNMYRMFYDAAIPKSFDLSDILNQNLPAIVNITGIIADTDYTGSKQLEFNSQITDLSQIFYRCTEYPFPVNVPSNVTNLYQSFCMARNVPSVSISDLSKITNMRYTFSSLNINSKMAFPFDNEITLSNDTDAYGACMNSNFSNNITNVSFNLSSSNNTNIGLFFNNCTNQNISLASQFLVSDDSYVNAHDMLSGCKNLYLSDKTLDLSRIGPNTDVSNMFRMSMLKVDAGDYNIIFNEKLPYNLSYMFQNFAVSDNTNTNFHIPKLKFTESTKNCKFMFNKLYSNFYVNDLELIFENGIDPGAANYDYAFFSSIGTFSVVNNFTFKWGNIETGTAMYPYNIYLGDWMSAIKNTDNVNINLYVYNGTQFPITFSDINHVNYINIAYGAEPGSYSTGTGLFVFNRSSSENASLINRIYADFSNFKYDYVYPYLKFYSPYSYDSSSSSECYGDVRDIVITPPNYSETMTNQPVFINANQNWRIVNMTIRDRYNTQYMNTDRSICPIQINGYFVSDSTINSYLSNNNFHTQTPPMNINIGNGFRSITGLITNFATTELFRLTVNVGKDIVYLNNAINIYPYEDRVKGTLSCINLRIANGATIPNNECMANMFTAASFVKKNIYCTNNIYQMLRNSRVIFSGVSTSLTWTNYNARAGYNSLYNLYIYGNL